MYLCVSWVDSRKSRTRGCGDDEVIAFYHEGLSSALEMLSEQRFSPCKLTMCFQFGEYVNDVCICNCIILALSMFSTQRFCEEEKIVSVMG